MEVTPGYKTTEFWLTLAAMVVGGVLESISTVLAKLGEVHPNSVGYGIALAVVGMLIQVAGLFGYQKGRATVKAAALMADSGNPMVVAQPGTVVQMKPTSPTMAPAQQ